MSMPTFNPTEHEVWGLIEGYELNPDYYGPDGEPWCRFGKGLFCANSWRCKNKYHREYKDDEIDQV